MSYKQAVDQKYFFTGGDSVQIFTMIDNYIYLYHTDTLILIPTYPESINDSTKVGFEQSTMLSRSAPIYSYSNSGPRDVSVSLRLHRDMMNSVNISSGGLNLPNLSEHDYIDELIKQLEGAVLPVYGAAEKMVDPPLVAIRLGNDIFCKGVVTSGITRQFSGPILRTNKYAEVSVDFTVSEVEPYDAISAMTAGTYRGISQDLERRIWKRG